MFSIAVQELKQLLLSIKAIIVVLIIAGSSFFVADSINSLGDDVGKSLGSDGAALGVTVNVFIFGLLFIAALSHDVINREVSSKTIRFLITRIDRKKFILGKYIGITAFWGICMLLSYSLIAFSAGKFHWVSFIDSFVFLAVGIAFYMFISTIISKTSVTLFFGLIFAVFFPILSLVSIYSDKIWLKPIKFITPYNYSILGGYYILINVLLAVVLIAGTMITFERKDL